MIERPSVHSHERTLAEWRVGLVGFSYPEWTRTLYAGVRARDGAGRLRAYASVFNTVEINTSFYAIPPAASLRTWGAATPEDFRFCIKMVRDVTHGRTPAGSLASAVGPPSGHLVEASTIEKATRLIETARVLGPKLGAVLLQFPARFEPSRAGELFALLDVLGGEGVPLAVECRHPGWNEATILQEFAARRVCVAHTDETNKLQAAHEPALGRVLPVTSEMLYVRWLGKHGQFVDRTKEWIDPSVRLRWWANAIQRIMEQHPSVRRVYGFFDNDFAGHAPVTARRMLALIGGESVRIGREGRETLFDAAG